LTADGNREPANCSLCAEGKLIYKRLVIVIEYLYIVSFRDSEALPTQVSATTSKQDSLPAFLKQEKPFLL